MKPSIGRVVHYVAYGTPGGEYPSVCRAAIITEVSGKDVGEHDAVALAVLNPTGLFFNLNVACDPSGKMPGTWHWPERVE